jgi:hypothetical protein
MDNGLIFPYPYGIANAETVDAKSSPKAFGRRGVTTRSGGRQADGETQEGSCTGRWLSRSKGVGLCTGKSVHCVPET